MSNLLSRIKAATEAAKANAANTKLAAMKSAVVAKNAAMEGVIDTFDEDGVKAIARGLGFKMGDFKPDAPESRVSLKVHSPKAAKGEEFLYVQTQPQKMASGPNAGGVYIRAESVRQTIADLQEALVLLEGAGFKG